MMVGDSEILVVNIWIIEPFHCGSHAQLIRTLMQEILPEKLTANSNVHHCGKCYPNLNESGHICEYLTLVK